MAETKEKFATQVDRTLLKELRGIAREEGRQIQALVDEAIEDLLEKRRQAAARPHVMAAYQSSHARFALLYKKLAQ